MGGNEGWAATCQVLSNLTCAWKWDVQALSINSPAGIPFAPCSDISLALQLRIMMRKQDWVAQVRTKLSDCALGKTP